VFRIRHAAQLAGINPTLLRAWERRYHLVAPQRTASGYRVYSEADVEVLRGAARLVAAGHAISEVARLSPPLLLAAAAKVTGADSPAGADDKGEIDASSGDDQAVDTALAAALRAITAFDRQQFEAALFPVTTLTTLGPVAVCERVLLPLLRLIGDGWQEGQLSVAAEHFGSALCRTKILQYLEFVARRGTGPRVVCACPENELHEGGLLAFAVHAAVARWQVIYLGASTPLTSALDTAVRIAADMVALSMTVARKDEEIDELVRLIRELRQARPGLRVIAGGSEALARRQQLAAAGIEVTQSIGVALAHAARGSKKTRAG
jgi:methanogenic corrinoid protein MtbC1